MHARLSFRRTIGFLLILIGALLFPSLAPIVIPQGAFTTWLVFWATCIPIFIGCFLIFEMGLKAFMKPLLAGVSVLAIITMIFLTPIPVDLQFLLLSLLSIAILVFSYNSRRKHGRKQP